MISFIQAQTEEQRRAVRALNSEYIGLLESLGFDLAKDPTFSRSELHSNSEKFMPPCGFQLLATLNDEPVGTVSVRMLTEGVCELNRLYVKPTSRGRGIGEELIRRAISQAKRIGYRVMRLDSHALLKDALRRYRSSGFEQIAPYYNNPMADLIYFELALDES